MTRPAGTVLVDQQIGARIRSFRRGRGMSQAELGAVLGVTFQQIQKYENGKNRVSGSRLVQVCEALECTPAKLLGHVGGNGAHGPQASSIEALQDIHVHRVVLALGKMPEAKRKRMAIALEQVVEAAGLK